MTLRTASALAALAATLLVAGCGGSDNDTEPPRRRPTTAPAYDYGQAPAKTPEAAPSEDAATIKAASGALGAMLVDAEGRSLYLWEADQGARAPATARAPTPGRP